MGGCPGQTSPINPHGEAAYIPSHTAFPYQRTTAETATSPKAKNVHTHMQVLPHCAKDLTSLQTKRRKQKLFPKCAKCSSLHPSTLRHVVVDRVNVLQLQKSFHRRQVELHSLVIAFGQPSRDEREPRVALYPHLTQGAWCGTAVRVRGREVIEPSGNSRGLGAVAKSNTGNTCSDHREGGWDSHHRYLLDKWCKDLSRLEMSVAVCCDER